MSSFIKLDMFLDFKNTVYVESSKKNAEQSKQWLQTDLGGGDRADLAPEVGAKASLEKIFSATKEDNGQFLNIKVEGWENAAGPNKYDGLNPPW